MELFLFFLGLSVLLIPYKIETKIKIVQPKDKVMLALNSFDNYILWNPFIKHINGEFRLNSVLNVKLNMNDKTMHIHPKMIILEKDRFCWRGSLGIRYIFDGIHCFKVEKISENTTLFIHTEHFQGLLVWLMFPMLLKTKERFELMNEALKEEVEQRYKVL